MELLLDTEKRYSYADYLTWMDDKRRELVDGYIRMMSAPKAQHQEIIMNLSAKLYNIIERNRGGCKIYPVPFDVRLPKNGEREDNKIDTVVQPDICIVCNPAKIEERGCLGAPDFIAEIYSPSTIKYDLGEKFNLYEAVGVREYWVVLPAAVQVFILQSDGKYDKGTVYEDGKIPVHIFDGIEIEYSDIFKDILKL
ncbi:MAG: Uma2 family endonuclease [Prevotellaceae bacterium]|jgi:Uma2 family endonuclease|nr:Uma2 family endonuclease [Prevotellaceae bacterium]